MTTELHIGSRLMPSGLPPDRAIHSSIVVIEITEQGYRFRRVNTFYNGEEFFLNRGAFLRSQWIPIPNDVQLTLNENMEYLERYWTWLCDQMFSPIWPDGDMLIYNEIQRVSKHITYERKLVAMKQSI